MWCCVVLSRSVVVNCLVLNCLVLPCIVLHGVGLCCFIAVRCDALYGIDISRVVLYCIALQSIVC